jgi:hypothetical protein
VIGGRVLDTTALLDAATGKTAFTRALLTVAGELGIVLAIPSAALAEAWAVGQPAEQPFLELLTGRSVLVIDPLDGEDAEDVGRYASHGGSGRAQIGPAHAVHCAVQRGWPIVTAEPAVLRRMHPQLDVVEIP